MLLTEEKNLVYEWCCSILTEFTPAVHIDMSSPVEEQEQPAVPLQLDVKFESIPETLESSYKEHFPVFDKGLVRGEPGGFIFHPHYASNAEKIYNMKVRSDDVWIRTFPRSGILF